MLSVGYQLKQARQARRLTLEDVAFETRIPHTRLRDMEEDDLSNFANLTYAKSFLKLYSRYLQLDLSGYLDQLDTSLISDVTGHEYVQTASAVRLLSAPAIAMDHQTRPRGGILLGVAGLTALLLGGGWIFYTFRGGENASPRPASPAKTQEPTANDNTSRTGSSVSNTQPSGDSNALAKADLGTLGQPPPSSASPAPKATIVPDIVVPKATPVDDEGNETTPPRPERL